VHVAFPHDQTNTDESIEHEQETRKRGRKKDARKEKKCGNRAIVLEIEVWIEEYAVIVIECIPDFMTRWREKEEEMS
jgi:hypothetical protein